MSKKPKPKILGTGAASKAAETLETRAQSQAARIAKMFGQTKRWGKK